MEFSTLAIRTVLVFTLVSIAITSSYSYPEYPEEYHNPGDMLAKALYCFNNRFIYSGCNEAYRLTESGNIDVPVEATDIFCNGPCLAETQYVLNCIDTVLSDFTFNNKASIRDIRTVLYRGCSDTSHRGHFDVRRYIEGDYMNNGQKVHNFNIGVHVFFTILMTLLMLSCLLIL